MATRGRGSKQKGKQAELELVHLLNEEYGCDVRRGKVYYGEPDIVGLSGIHIECKRQEKLNLSAAMGQSIGDAEKFKDGSPVVIHRKNREGWLVTMPLSLFMDMHQSWKMPFS